MALIALVALMVLMLSVALPRAAHAAPPAPDPLAKVEALSVSPDRVNPGQVLRITGRGCRPGRPVEVTVFRPDPEHAGSVVAGMAGLFAASVRLPKDAQPGRVWIRATCPGADGHPRVLDATVAVVAPLLVVTWVNVLFGLGTALAVAGFGLAGRRRPGRGKRRRRPEPPRRPRARRRRKGSLSGRRGAPRVPSRT
jgi:hypothetical protein